MLLVAIAPDGQTLAYRASENGVFRLYRRALNELDAHEIPGTENSSEAPFFSPDGRWVGFIVDGTLMKVSLQGGRPVRIADVGGATRGANWGLDDSIVVGAFGRGLLRVHASGGDVVSLAKSDDGRVYWYPQVLPGGAVLFTASRQAPDSGDVIGLNPQTGVKRTVVARAVAGRYTPSGHLVFVRGGDLWAVRFDPRRLEVSGDPGAGRAGDPRRRRRGGADRARRRWHTRLPSAGRRGSESRARLCGSVVRAKRNRWVCQ